MDKDFKDFLIKKVNPRDNSAHPFCNACSVFILNKKFNISSHKNSKDHKEAIAKYAEKQQQEIEWLHLLIILLKTKRRFWN